jgi:hypothetical protein|tara:strand:- start:655 stop:1218 length:564 start_codon:yes stop_codon:yes gene_type:complete
MWNSKYIIGSGSKNRMYCLYHSFDDYSSSGLIPRCHHVSNLSTDYSKAISKAKQIAQPDWNLIISKKPVILDDIVRDGSSKKPTYNNFYVDEPVVTYPASSFVGAVGETVSLTLGVTDSFYFDGSFGSTLCTKFVDLSHNIYTTYSSAKFVRELTVGDTIYCTAEVSAHSNYQEEKTTTIKKVKGAN